ncbi:MAG: hypothetical protein WEA36_08170 [Balneolaceae bacterium]
MTDSPSRTPGFRYVLLTLVGLAFGSLLAGCQFEAKQRPVLAFDRSNPTANGSRYPALASDGPDRVVMAWVSSIEERVSAIEVADRIETQWYAPRPVHVGEDLRLEPSDRPRLVIDENGTRWVSWRELRRGGRLVLSRQPEGSNSWIHSRIPTPDETLRQGVPRLALGDSVLVALWEEFGGAGTTLRLARWAADGVGDELRLDDGDGAGGWRAAGVPIRLQGELLGEPVLAVTGESSTTAWLEQVGDRVQLIVSRQDVGETETSSDREMIGEWSASSGNGHLHGTLSMARQERGALALAVAVEQEEGRDARLYLHESGDWTERTPELWNEQTGRPVVASDPNGGWILLWQQRGEPLASLWLQRFHADGSERDGETLVDPVRVGSVDSGLQSDRPSLIPLREEGIFLAWTQTDPFLRVRTALVPWNYQPDR